MIGHVVVALALLGTAGSSQDDFARQLFDKTDNDQMARLRGVKGVEVFVVPGTFKGNGNYEAIRIACENLLASAGLEPGKKHVDPKGKTSVLDEVLGPNPENDVLLFIMTEPESVRAVARVTDRVLVKRNKSEFTVETWQFMDFSGHSWTSRECRTPESYMQFALDATNKLISHVRKANK